MYVFYLAPCFWQRVLRYIRDPGSATGEMFLKPFSMLAINCFSSSSYILLQFGDFTRTISASFSLCERWEIKKKRWGKDCSRNDVFKASFTLWRRNLKTQQSAVILQGHSTDRFAKFSCKLTVRKTFNPLWFSWGSCHLERSWYASLMLVALGLFNLKNESYLVPKKGQLLF